MRKIVAALILALAWLVQKRASRASRKATQYYRRIARLKLKAYLIREKIDTFSPGFLLLENKNIPARVKKPRRRILTPSGGKVVHLDDYHHLRKLS